MKQELPPLQKVISRRKNGSIRVHTLNNEPSKTDQQFVDECDVNSIMAQYTKTGQFAHLRGGQGVFADISEIPNLLQATMIVQESTALFNELPAEARAKFENNPIKMMDFLQDPSNHQEAVKLGLMVPRKQANNDESNDDHQPESPAPKKAAKKPASENPT